MRTKFHDLLFWLFNGNADFVGDAFGYELPLFTRAWSPTLTSWGVWGLWLSYYAGWEYSSYAEYYETHVILHISFRNWRREYVLYHHVGDVHEYEEFPNGEFPNPWWYEQAEDDFWVRGIDTQAYPDYDPECDVEGEERAHEVHSRGGYYGTQ